jgi:hypothetical protein
MCFWPSGQLPPSRARNRPGVVEGVLAEKEFVPLLVDRQEARHHPSFYPTVAERPDAPCAPANDSRNGYAGRPLNVSRAIRTLPFARRAYTVR